MVNRVLWIFFVFAFSLLSANIPHHIACKNSFDGQTLVATENGLVSIESIKIGDKVWAYNEHNQTKSLQEVTHLIRGEHYKELIDIELSSGEVITTTDNHPFWERNTEEWLHADKLTNASLLLNINDKNVTIKSLKHYAKNKRVYNLTVNNFHTYFVGSEGVLGHNSGCRIPDTNTWQHIFKGEIKGGGRIVGYHHRMFGWDKGSLKVIKINRKGKAGNKGLYEGLVEYVDGNGNSHKKYSTFFPNSWSPRMVREEVNTALIKAIDVGVR